MPLVSLIFMVSTIRSFHCIKDAFCEQRAIRQRLFHVPLPIDSHRPVPQSHSESDMQPTVKHQ